MSTTWPFTVSVAAKAGAASAKTNAATVSPANVLRMKFSLKPTGQSLLIPRLNLYCAYEEGVNARCSRGCQRRGAACPDRTDAVATRRADGRSNPVAEARRLTRDFARRTLGCVHRSGNQLGRQRLRHRDLA